MRSKKSFLTGLLVPLLSVLLLVSACTNGGTVSTQDIQGVLQAMQGKEMVVKLDDGTVVKIQVENTKTADDAQKLVGKEVTVKAQAADDKGNRKALEVGRRGKGEDQQVTDTVSAITTNSFTVGGKTFKVDANTQMDSGLAAGVKARVEFITLPDGTLLARSIEADENEFRFSGKVEKKDDNSITVGGQSFKLNPASHLDDGINSGSTVKVKFERQKDNSLLATAITVDNSGVDVNKMRFSGKVESKDDKGIVLNGQTFKMNTDTKVDDNVKSGGKARVEFETQTDGSLLAKRILPDNGAATEDATTGGAITSISADTIVVGGNTFKIGPATTLDTGLAAGVNAKVEFVTLSDGTKLATDVETNVDDTKASGALTAMSGKTFTVGGKTFTVNAATRLDSGLVTGADVRVEFVTLADGTLLATEIETAPREAELRGQEAEPADDRGANSGADNGGGGGSGGGK